jgi:hypothetical protein
VTAERNVKGHIPPRLNKGYSGTTMRGFLLAEVIDPKGETYYNGTYFCEIYY